MDVREVADFVLRRNARFAASPGHRSVGSPQYRVRQRGDLQALNVTHDQVEQAVSGSQNTGGGFVRSARRST